MAKIQNSVFGSISGTIGPLVFSSNQFGSHVYKKKGRVSSKTNSVSLQTNFNKLSPLLWTSETQGARSGWNNFASNGFSNPRSNSNKKHSGYVVFNSCIKTFQTNYNVMLPFAINCDMGYTASPCPVTNLYYPQFAPTKMNVPFIQALNLNPVNINMGAIYINDLSRSTFEINFISSLSLPWNNNVLQDFNNMRLSFIWYLSPRLKKTTDLSKTLFHYALCSTGFIDFPTSTFDHCKLFTCSFDLHNRLHSLLKFDRTPRIHILTLAAISEKGTLCVISSKQITFTLSY